MFYQFLCRVFLLLVHRQGNLHEEFHCFWRWRSINCTTLWSIVGVVNVDSRHCVILCVLEGVRLEVLALDAVTKGYAFVCRRLRLLFRIKS